MSKDASIKQRLYNTKIDVCTSVLKHVNFEYLDFSASRYLVCIVVEIGWVIVVDIL